MSTNETRSTNSDNHSGSAYSGSSYSGSAYQCRHCEAIFNQSSIDKTIADAHDEMAVCPRCASPDCRTLPWGESQCDDSSQDIPKCDSNNPHGNSNNSQSDSNPSRCDDPSGIIHKCDDSWFRYLRHIDYLDIDIHRLSHKTRQRIERINKRLFYLWDGYHDVGKTKEDEVREQRLYEERNLLEIQLQRFKQLIDLQFALEAGNELEDEQMKEVKSFENEYNSLREKEYNSLRDKKINSTCDSNNQSGLEATP